MKKELYDSEYYTRGAKNLLLYPIGQLMDWINLALFEKRFPAGGRILEIGCGDGKVSRWMSSRGFEVEAIDISKEAIEIARRKSSQVQYYCSDVFGLHRTGGYYDAVYCLHVMEHIKEFESNLVEIKRLLKKGGLLVVRIPNIDSLEARLAGKDWFHWDEPYHVNHWGSDEFKRVLLDVGFGDVRVNFRLLEYKQVLLYSCLSKIGVRVTSRVKLWTLPLQVVFVPISIVLGFLFGNSGTVELIARKS